MGMRVRLAWRGGEPPPLRGLALEFEWRRLHELERLLHCERLALQERRELDRLRLMRPHLEPPPLSR